MAVDNCNKSSGRTLAQAGLSLRMPWLFPKPARVGFVVDILTLEQTFNTSM